MRTVVGVDLVLFSGIFISASALNSSSANETTSLWPSTFDFSFASKPEPNTCKSTDMCGTMPGICKNGDCRTRPCSNDIHCDCYAGFEGIYCDTPISKVDKNKGTQSNPSETGKTLVNGNVVIDKIKANSNGNGPKNSVTNKGIAGSNGNKNGVDNGSANNNMRTTTDNGAKDNGAKNGVASSKLKATSTEKSTTVSTVAPMTTPMASSASRASVTANTKVSTRKQDAVTKSTVETTVATDTGRTESVGEKINKKLKNGEIKVENVLDVLIASVKENEALAKNKTSSSKQKVHDTNTQASKEKSTTTPIITASTPTSTEVSTTAESTSRSTIHPDGSYIKGPESTYISDNSPLSLETANRTIKETANKQSVRNTTDTVTIPFTVLTLAGITATPKPKCSGNCSKQKTDTTVNISKVKGNKTKSELVSSKQPNESNVNVKLKENNEEKLVKIVESIIIHKPKGSVVSKSKETVNIESTPADNGLKKTSVSQKKDVKNNPNAASSAGANEAPVDRKTTGTNTNQNVLDSYTTTANTTAATETATASTVSTAVQTTTT